MRPGLTEQFQGRQSLQAVEEMRGEARERLVLPPGDDLRAFAIMIMKKGSAAR